MNTFWSKKKAETILLVYRQYVKSIIYNVHSFWSLHIFTSRYLNTKTVIDATLQILEKKREDKTFICLPTRKN